MKLQQPSARPGTILSILGSALVIYGMFFLPMVYGNGAELEWDVAGFFFNAGGPVSVWQAAAWLLALPLLSVLFVLGTSAASFFRELSPGMVTWRRIAALAGLIIQGPVGFVVAVAYSFSFNLGAGYWLVLLGFIVMIVGAFLKPPLQSGVEKG